MKKELLILPLICLLAFSCSNKNENSDSSNESDQSNEQRQNQADENQNDNSQSNNQIVDDVEIQIHTFFEGQSEEINQYKIKTHVGGCVGKKIYNQISAPGTTGGPEYVTGIFLDDEFKTKIKASQLLSYDESYSNLYVTGVGLDSVDINTFFNGNYSDNKGNVINFNQGKFTLNYNDNLITGDISIENIYFRFNNCKINDTPIEESPNFNDSIHYLSENTIEFDYLYKFGLLDIYYQKKIVDLVDLLASLNFIEFDSDYYLESQFYQNNQTIIDYDL